MLGSTALEVAISVVFLFIVMSIVASAVQEFIESFLQHRAIHLERGIRELLGDEAGHEAAKIYNHPVVASLFRGEYVPEHIRNAGRLKRGRRRWGLMPLRTHLPNYVPRRNFAVAVLDLALPPEQRAELIGNDRKMLSSVRAGAAQLPPRLCSAVLAAVDHAKGDWDQARRNLEDWYDSAMDRVAGWYKKRTQRILFAIGLALAILLNIDTITIAKHLYVDESVRAAIVTEAEATAQRVGGSESTDSALLAALGCADAGQPSTAGPKRQASCAQQRLEALNFPMGWEEHPLRDIDYSAGWTLAFPIILNSLFGWLLTAVAVTFGAPFWFDILNKIMVIRSTVKPREKSPEEFSEDRQRPSLGGDRRD
ncbi:MAG TPA: hypothetical protein VGC46_15525 [Allosphingosinicella sp.]